MPSACATLGSAAQTPVARPSTFTVTLRVAGSSRFCARPPRRSVTSSISMSAALEAVEDDEAVPARALAEADVERRRLQRRPPARHRQQHRLRGRRAAEGAGQREVAEEAVAAGLEVAVEVEHRARDRQLGDAQAPRRLLDAADPDGAVAGEEVAVGRGDERRERALEVHVEAEAGVVGLERDPPVDDPLAGRRRARRSTADVVERARSPWRSGGSAAFPRCGAASRRCRPRAPGGRGRRRAGARRWRSRPRASACRPARRGGRCRASSSGCRGRGRASRRATGPPPCRTATGRS